MLEVNVHDGVLPPGDGEDVVVALLPGGDFEDAPAPLPSFLDGSMVRPSLSSMIG
jgi:hypothetical protein